MRVGLFHWNHLEAADHAAWLRSAGYDVVVLHSGGQAELRTLAEDPPVAFIIDLSRLPSHGRDVGIWLRTRRATRQVPLLFVGGAGEKVAGVRKHLPDAVFTTWESLPIEMPRAIADPLEDPVVPDSVLAGYSGTPLPKKLGIKPESTVCLVAAPEGFEAVLGSLPSGVELRWSNRGKRDLTLWFSTSRSDVERRVGSMRTAIAGGPIWICWPKRASRVHTDLSESVVREIGLAAGLVDYKIAAIDQTWSGLLFTERKTPPN